MIRILLVEDEPLSADSLAFNLTRDGFEVHTIGDGSAALGPFDAQRPDLLLLDICLPGMDGLEICRQVRARSTIPIIMVSGLQEEQDRVVGLEVGADDYITKPFSYPELLARIRSVLRRIELDQRDNRPQCLSDWQPAAGCFQPAGI
jgi:DNA-binding response OmpR family regulator